ncbi:putative chromatin-remodeling complex ATPase chain [Curcuma longa]|uniref:putative chromatin-remodeling complex ATPase chain n=1 Tax=Curcuma longa TaxID=136217 RepID=UPI003D9E6C6F
MTRLLDILEDYLLYRGYQYCRIDGNTGGDERDASIEAFNQPGSQKLMISELFDMSIMQYAIEEKVIERAYKKLALDALVIQQGRLAEQKTVNKDELLQMVRFGAEMVFSSKDSTITDEDIDRIIAKGEETTAELDAKMKKFTEDAIKFKMDNSMLIPS